jgi:CheY-like chemotaxis protein
VVLDILLEGESAWDLLAELKQSADTRDLPVWVVTMVDNQHKARALGADDFCVKPVDRSWLLERLRGLVGPGGREKVLVVDDDEVSRYLLRGLLADTRYEALEAADGESGLRLAREGRPRAVFLDLDLPGRSGLEVLQALRADPATRELPVIIHTARVLEGPERQRLAREAVAVLSKEAPSREVAVARVREALARAVPGGPPGGGGYA